MITQSCPSGCSCWELPSENLIKMDCNTLKFGTANGKKSTLKGFMEMHEPLEFEMDLSGKKLGLIDQSFMKGNTGQESDHKLNLEYVYIILTWNLYFRHLHSNEINKSHTYRFILDRIFRQVKS